MLLSQQETNLYTDLESHVGEPLHHVQRSLAEKLLLVLQTARSLHSTLRSFFDPEHDELSIISKFTRTTRVLKSIEISYEFALKAIKTACEIEFANLKEKYEFNKEELAALKRNTDIAMVPLKHMVDFMLETLLSQLEKVIDLIANKKSAYGNNSKPFLLKSYENMSMLQVITTKIETVHDHFAPTLTFCSKDLFFRDKSSCEVWKDLHKDVTFKKYITKAEFDKGFKFFSLFLNAGYAVLSKKGQASKNPESAKQFSFLKSAGYYGINAKEAQLEANVYLTKPPIENAFTMWGVVDIPFISQCMSMQAPLIAYDQLIYVDRLFPAITREKILKEYKEGTLNSFEPLDLHVPDLSHKIEEVKDDLFCPREDKVQIRVLSPWPLSVSGEGCENLTELVKRTAQNLLSFTCPQPETPNADGIIIHIHGGGFVATSSAFHKNYLIRWAKNLNKIVFAIDYRLAPKNTYPEILDDVWQGYLWIVNYATSVLGIKHDKVILSGDSAGGNIAAALILRLIKAKLPTPQGCYLLYPALNLNTSKFSPSYFSAINDVVLPYSLLKLCVKAYAPDEYNPEIDPYLSPVIMSEEFLKEFPPVRIAVGEQDPLNDDCWRFLHRLKNLKKEAKMTVYHELGHGFLGFNQIKRYDWFARDGSDLIQELLNL